MSDEREFLTQSREALDASAAAIDPATRTRLRAARREALAAAARPRARWLPATGLAAAASVALIAVAVWRAGDPPAGRDAAVDAPQAPVAATPVEPIPLAAAEDLELYLDLDFFTWLAEDADAG